MYSLMALEKANRLQQTSKRVTPAGQPWPLYLGKIKWPVNPHGDRHPKSHNQLAMHSVSPTSVGDTKTARNEETSVKCHSQPWTVPRKMGIGQISSHTHPLAVPRKMLGTGIDHRAEA